MAHKQSVPAVHLGGQDLKQLNKKVDMVSQGHYISEDNAVLDAVSLAVDNGQKYFEERQKIENHQARLKATATLGRFRQRLQEAHSPEDFEEIAQQSDCLLRATFDDDEKDQLFFKQQGAEILENNRLDVERLFDDKQKEFAQNKLIEMLVDAQNVLGQVPVCRGSDILDIGVDEIENTSFLTAAEKENFKQDFLKNGILNLALQNPAAAQENFEKYLPDDNNLKSQLAEIERINAENLSFYEQQQQRQEELFNLHTAFQLWQEKEKGKMSEAAYFVYSAGVNEKVDAAIVSAAPLTEAYLFLKNYDGQKAAYHDLQYVGNCFAAAYKKGLMNLDETAAWQNLLLDKSEQGGRFFDEALNDLTDEVLASDTTDDSVDAQIFMENKAKMQFELYDAYMGYKKALVREFEENGGQINSGIERYLARQATVKLCETFGFCHQEDLVSFEELKKVLDEVSLEADTGNIWQKFCKQAPFAEDKVALMRRLISAKA